MSFNNLGLSEPFIKAAAAENYLNPTPIQEKAIPAVLAGKDFFGIARTGSGKTASFVLPVLQLLQENNEIKNRHIQCLVMVPTRELAAQVAEVFQKFNGYLTQRLKTLAVFGGVSINPQMMQLQGTDILVATPGRLLDLISCNALGLSGLKILIIDEADKMLNLGFRDEMNEIFRLLPKKRQTLLFSATEGEEIGVMVKNMLSNPVLMKIAEAPVEIELITQSAYHVTAEKKGVLLRYLIRHKEMKQVLVFVSSTHRADHVVVKLVKNGIDAAAMHSKKSQGARADALKRFKDGSLKVLVATDLASRGIDVPFLPFVINYELPRSPTDYVHRIGRTGRVESPGEAISLVSPEEGPHFKVIQKKMKKVVPMIETADLNLQGF